MPKSEKPESIFIVECFDERDAVSGMGGSFFIANGIAYRTMRGALKMYKKAKSDGIAASIRRLPILGE